MSNILDMYARAAATLYGIITLDDFVKILDNYYGEGVLSGKRITAYLRSTENDDPIYYIRGNLIVHASIPPDEVTRTLSEIQHPVGVTAPAQRRILPEKEFLLYADPSYYEPSSGAQKMEEYLTGDLGLSREDAREIVGEVVFVCRTGSCPTFIINALARRDIPYGQECEMELLLMGIEIDEGTRQWERLGATGVEMAGR